MRAALLSVLLLAACNQPTAQARPEQPPAASITGAFAALSNTAMGITGDTTIEAARISFAKGGVLDTAPAGPIDATNPIAQGQPSFAETYVGPVNLTLELRRISNEQTPQGVQSLCGEHMATYVALAYDQPVTAVTLLVFSGADAPGPNAVNSQLCGAFSYAAP